MRNIILLFVMLFVGTACQQGGKKSDAQANIERDADEREIPRFNGNEKEQYSYETDPINSIKAMTPEELGPEEKMELKSMKDKIDHAKVSTYHNLRYGYKMKYLNVLVPQEEAESGEGKDFSYNGITLGVGKQQQSGMGCGNGHEDDEGKQHIHQGSRQLLCAGRTRGRGNTLLYQGAARERHMVHSTPDIS